MLPEKNYLLPFLQNSFYFFPLALILGSIALNLNITFFLIIGIVYLFINKIKLKFNFINISLLLFFITLILSSYLNLGVIGQENFLKSFFLLRFYLLYILIETLIYNKKIKLNYFFYICSISILFLSLDLALQFFYGKNILGFAPWDGRITGVFEDEAVAGAYIQKIFIFAVISTILFSNPIIKNKSFLPTIFFIIIIFASFIASNRISFFILIITILFLIIFFKPLRKKLIISLLILLPFFYYFFQTDTQVNSRYKGFVNKVSLLTNFSKNDTLKKNSSLKTNINESKNNAVKRLPNHGKIFLTSLKSFEDNKIFGNGLKSFRYKCKNFLNQKNTLCSTHPHNYHLEILHDTGIIGFTLITVFVISLLAQVIKLIFSSKLSYNQKLVLALLTINFLIEVFPFKSTGSIFTTWNGTLLWLSISLINYKKTYEKNQKF